MKPTADPQIRSFPSQEEWEKWMARNYTLQEGIWLRIYKKVSGVQSINYREALDEALCYGWIDGQKKSYDSESWLQRFTPRRPKSVWSKINRDHVDRLIKAGKMREPGLKVVAAAKADGRWESAYDSQSNADIPLDFQSELDKNPQAQQFFLTLNKSNTYAILYRLQTAKRPETRNKRIQQFIAMLNKGEKLHL